MEPWNTLLPIEQYTESLPDDNKYEFIAKGETKPVFPHNLPELLRANGGLNLIRSVPSGNTLTKDFAIELIKNENLGKSSETASRAALAAGMQGKYMQMHNALLNTDKRLDDKIVMDIAKSVGLDVKKLKKDMDSKDVTDILDANRQLAEKLHLMGTPAFIVASTPEGKFKKGTEPSFVPGASTEEALQEMIKKAAGN